MAENESQNTNVEAIQRFVKKLSDEHKMLVVLKKQLYGGSWGPMIEDLRNRLEGKPYIFKLTNRINEDIERIKEMREFEERYDTDLCEHVNLG
jgi:hypothetical protein